MGKFTLNTSWLKNKTAKWEEQLDALNERIYQSSQAYVPVSRPNQKFAGPYESDRQLKKLQGPRGRRAAHRPGTLKRSGRRVEADNLSGGVAYTAPYAIFVEVGTSKMTGRHYLLKALEDHREEIETGAFLKEE